MRVVFIALHFAEYSAHLAAALATSNEVLLILNADNAENELGSRLDSDFLAEKLRIVKISHPRNFLDVIGNARKIWREISAFSPEIIHLQENLRDELMLLMPLMKRYPIAMTIHDPENHSGHDSKAMRFSRYRLYRLLARRRIDSAFAHGANMVSQVEKILPRLRGRVHSIHHGPLGSSDSLGVSEESPVESCFLFFGRIHAYKGLKYFVEAIKLLRLEGLSVVGVIAGRGSDLVPNMPAINEVPEAFRVMNRYISEEEVRVIFAHTTAAVLPYLDGTQSGVAAMALGYGRPVIATRVGSIPELVRAGVNGLLINPADVNELADAMRSLVKDELLRKSLATGALELRDGELSWGQVAKVTSQAYEATVRQFRLAS
ncbi:glycosyltransferase family 4 protein [Paucibacter sp. TC2R-5]|uniref:glycosyltransferase family 4 protein n=1 Tax=Paucibacter sp. TC2R-5 TaxID=2893555 RepID=UPI0021E46102|nr:glycosyltransferase family 4 protein [Paucibacter sp. TC2R-5]MCV2360218.1 glycosyltransferase family 4 protein [Paucibacter sp. TC2R-5]